MSMEDVIQELETAYELREIHPDLFEEVLSRASEMLAD